MNGHNKLECLLLSGFSNLVKYLWVGTSLTREHLTKLERSARNKHSNLLCPFESYKENQVLWIWSQNFVEWISCTLNLTHKCKTQVNCLMLRNIRPRQKCQIEKKTLFCSFINYDGLKIIVSVTRDGEKHRSEMQKLEENWHNDFC